MKLERRERPIRILRPLSQRPGGASFLAAEGGRRPRWVLRWLQRASPGPLRDSLRGDLPELCSLSHPALLLPAAFGTDPETKRAYLLRPYREGTDFLAALQGKAPKDLPPWLGAAAAALSLLHRSGLAHGNVKPTNLLVPRGALFARAPRSPRVLLCDPACSLLESRERALHSDLAALGRAFYLLLTGRAAEPEEKGFPPSPAELNPAVPCDLERIVLKLLHPEAGKGYRSASELVLDLKTLSEGPRGRKAWGGFPAPEGFFGREGVLRPILHCLRDSSRPAAIAIAGEGGIGKTSFLERLALEAQLLGYRATSARSYLETSKPLEPVWKILEELIPPGPSGRGLRARYRRLRAASRGAPSAEDASGRRLFLRALLDLLVDAASPGPVLLLVDDAHLGDPLTLELLLALVREADRGEAAGAPSLAISFRSEGPFRQAVKPLRDAFSRRTERVLALELEPLTGDAVRAWLRAALGDAPEARDLAAGSAAAKGSPHFIQEAIQAAAAAAAGGERPPKAMEGARPDPFTPVEENERELPSTSSTSPSASSSVARPAGPTRRSTAPCASARRRPRRWHRWSRQGGRRWRPSGETGRASRRPWRRRLVRPPTTSAPSTPVTASFKGGPTGSSGAMRRPASSSKGRGRSSRRRACQAGKPTRSSSWPPPRSSRGRTPAGRRGLKP